jgi:hypothetical protein
VGLVVTAIITEHQPKTVGTNRLFFGSLIHSRAVTANTRGKSSKLPERWFSFLFSIRDVENFPFTGQALPTVWSPMNFE